MNKTQIFMKKYPAEAKHLRHMLAACDKTQSPLKSACVFLKGFLRPSGYAMQYRYEHCLRTAEWGRKIARQEGWDTEPLMIGCLLHDVGYPFCKTIEEWPFHAEISAQIAEMFLDAMGYHKAVSASICRAIAIHDQWMHVPADATPFELSVRDADDLDRFDALRLCLISHGHVQEKNAAEVQKICLKRLDELKEWHQRPCGTKTAAAMWEETLSLHREAYLRLLRQMQNTLDLEAFLLSK